MKSPKTRASGFICFGFAAIFMGDLMFRDKHDKSSLCGLKPNITTLTDTIPARKDTSSSSPKIDLRGSQFYGPVAMGPYATQINNFRETKDYTSLLPATRQIVVNNLKQLKNAYPHMPKIELADINSSVATLSAIDELNNMLAEAGIDAIASKDNQHNYGNFGMFVNYGNQDSTLYIDFFKAIRPYIRCDNITPQDFLPREHYFKAFFIGSAEYQTSGEVFIH